MKLHLSFLIVPLALVTGQFDVERQTISRVPIMEDATYRCSFENQWSSSRHPRNYPSDAHWSPPVIASHNGGYSMWMPGGSASRGVEDVAETGSSINLFAELRQGGDGVRDWQIGIVTFNSEQQSQNLGILRVDSSRPFISSISMIAPSPDWFSGFYDYRANDGSFWYRQFVIDTFPWDAGTERGNDYDLSNPSEDRPISRFTTANVRPTGVFLNQASTDVLPVATWTCTLVNSDPPEQSGGGSNGDVMVISTDQRCYGSGELIQVTFQNPRRPRIPNWIGIYPASADPNRLEEPELWVRACGRKRCREALDQGRVVFGDGGDQGEQRFPLRNGQYRAHLIRKNFARGSPYRAVGSSEVFRVITASSNC